MSDVVVVGSANQDLVLRVDTLPRPGETTLARGRAETSGGKGLNQVVAAARAGASTTLIAAVGNDAAGDRLVRELHAASVDTSRVRRAATATGLAVVTVDSAGENCIVVDAGANAALLDLSESDSELAGSARVVLLQLEIPVATVAAAARAAQAGGAHVVLNAAPVRAIPSDLLAVVDTVVVNEQEARALSAKGGSSSDLDDVVQDLLRHVANVVVTLGGAGSLLATRGGGVHHLDALRVTPVDTTGAGDTFVGYLGAGLAQGMALRPACRLAGTAAALSVQRPGATASIPTRREVDRAG